MNEKVDAWLNDYETARQEFIRSMELFERSSMQLSRLWLELDSEEEAYAGLPAELEDNLQTIVTYTHAAVDLHSLTPEDIGVFPGFILKATAYLQAHSSEQLRNSIR